MLGTMRTLAKNLRALASGNDLVAQLEEALRELEAQRQSGTAAEGICRALIERHYDGWPAPPAELRLHVGASDGLVNFWSKGISSSDAVVRAFGVDPGGPVLDWGCGSGRTLLWLRRYDAWRTHYTGCDVDAQAVAWLRSQGVDQVAVCGDSPPLPYDEATFVGLFGFSVLTHIPPERHRQWYEELRRILRPGGVAYVTTHGAWEAGKATEAARRSFEAGGAAYDVHPHTNHYKDSSIVSADFTREAVRGLLDVVDYAEQGYLNQDAWTLRRAQEETL